jgi:MoaE-MoaD fusion protein
MKVTVRYFSFLRAQLGTEEVVDLDQGATLGALVDRLRAVHPVLDRAQHLRWAVNEEFAQPAMELSDGDTIAVIAPVAGGSAPYIRLDREPLDPAELLQAVSGPGQGGICLFVGVVRDHNLGRDVTSIDYEAYEPMALKVLNGIVEECEASAEGVRVAVAHRVGRLEVGDTAVVIAASAPHRAESFAAARQCIERIKEDLPVWKMEAGPSGDWWVGERP